MTANFSWYRWAFYRNIALQCTAHNTTLTESYYREYLATAFSPRARPPKALAYYLAKYPVFQFEIKLTHQETNILSHSIHSPDEMQITCTVKWDEARFVFKRKSIMEMTLDELHIYKYELRRSSRWWLSENEKCKLIKSFGAHELKQRWRKISEKNWIK